MKLIHKEPTSKLPETDLLVVFAFEGLVMGSRMTHSVGGPDGTRGWPLLH